MRHLQQDLMCQQRVLIYKEYICRSSYGENYWKGRQCWHGWYVRYCGHFEVDGGQKLKRCLFAGL